MIDMNTNHNTPTSCGLVAQYSARRKGDASQKVIEKYVV
jgi:hypothetical protein